MNKILKILLDNYNNNTSDIFRASEYWKEKNQSIIEEIKKKILRIFVLIYLIYLLAFLIIIYWIIEKSTVQVF